MSAIDCLCDCLGECLCEILCYFCLGFCYSGIEVCCCSNSQQAGEPPYQQIQEAPQNAGHPPQCQHIAIISQQLGYPPQQPGNRYPIQQQPGADLHPSYQQVTAGYPPQQQPVIQKLTISEFSQMLIT